MSATAQIILKHFKSVNVEKIAFVKKHLNNSFYNLYKTNKNILDGLGEKVIFLVGFLNDILK